MDDLSPLNHLLKAPSKATVEKVLNLTFASRGDIPQPTIDHFKELLDVADPEAEALYRATYACVDVSITTGSVEALGQLFEQQQEGSAEAVDGRLKNLIGQVVHKWFFNLLFLYSHSLFLAPLNRSSAAS